MSAEADSELTPAQVTPHLLAEHDAGPLANHYLSEGTFYFSSLFVLMALVRFSVINSMRAWSRSCFVSRLLHTDIILKKI